MKPPIARDRRNRSGTTILIVVVALSVVSLLAVTVTASVLQLRRLHDAAARRLQAEWLCESALDRAAARLTTNPAYPGETWRLTRNDLGLPADAAGEAGAEIARVEILVQPVPDRPKLRRVEARAEYPLNHREPARVVREWGSLEINVRSSSP